MTTTLEKPTRETQEKSPVDICASLRELCESSRTKKKFYHEALHAIAEYFGSPYAAIRITHSTSTMDERYASSENETLPWALTVEELVLEGQAENSPIARLYAVEGTSLQVAALAVPITEHTHRPIGAMSLIAQCNDPAFLKAYLSEFTALIALASTCAREIESRGLAASGDDSALKRAIVKATDFESLDELAFAVTNSLKNKFNCEQVILGQVRGGSIRIRSISGFDNVYPKSPGVQSIRQAMEECLDSGEPICCQEEDKWSDQQVSTGHRLHRKWHEEVSGASVASVPMMVGERVVAVLAMSRQKKNPFSAEEIALIHSTVTPFAPAIMLVAKADRGLTRHAKDTFNNAVGWLFARRSYRRKAMVLAILASIAYFCFAMTGYDITVSSRITPTEIRYFASPFEGTIKACHVEVGDQVVKGQLLYEMDTSDLKLQQAKLESDLEVLLLKANQALASEDVRSVALAGAEIDCVEAQLAIVLHNLAGASVRAPSDGTVVSGTLSKRIGEVVPMGSPLFEFVPQGDWAIELLIPETMADELKVGFEGQFACSARPGELLECKIIRIHPSSEPINGNNVFIAEATVKANPAWMRSGMEGVAQIDIGQRRVWWVALHRVIDYLHLNFWM
jgi:hypothetical protein